jgi:hypothetical protein
MMLRLRGVRMLLSLLIVFSFTLFSRAQAVNVVDITMLSYTYNCSTNMATVRYHITNTDEAGHVGGYNTNYTINLGVYSTSGFIANGDDDVEFTGGYIIGDVIECKAFGVGNNFSYARSFDYQGYLPKPAAPDIWINSPIQLCSGQTATLTASGSNGDYIWSNGETGSSITVSTAGTYTVRVIGSCGNSDPSNAIVVNVGGTSAAPVIGASPATTLCNGGSATLFTYSNSGGTLHWSNGAVGATITVSSPGTYYVYEETGCGNSPNSNSVVITAVNTSVAPVITSSNGTTLCNGATTTLSVVSSGGGIIYWNTGETGNSITVSNAGSYNVYEGTPCGTTGYSNTITISAGAVPSPPMISSNQAPVLCDGASATIFVPGSPAGITWSTGESGPSITVSADGNYTAKITNACGTSGNSNVISFSTRSTPAAPAISPAGPVSFCSGGSTSLAVSGGGNFSWYRDGVYFSAAGSVVVSTAGTYTAYNSNSCGTSPASNAVVVSILSKPPAPTVTPPGNQLLCNGVSATFNASGTNITWSNGVVGNTMTTSLAGTYYAYDRNTCGNSSNSNSVIISAGVCPTPAPGTAFSICPGSLKMLDAGAGYETYSWNNGEISQKIFVGPGNYAVTVTKNGCTATSVMVTVSYYTVTVPVINPSGPLTFCNGGSVVLSSSVGAAYLWSNGAVTNPLTVTTPGTYNVTVTDANGCQATSANTTVVVNPLPTASIAGTNAVCQHAADPSVLFTGNNATGPYTFFYKINGGSTLTAVTTSGNSVSVNVPTNVFGTFVYELVGVQESGSTTCYNAASGSATVTVNELPTATIVGTSTVCQNSAAPSITYSASGGVAPYIFTYKLNGVTQTVMTTSGNTVSVVAPTNVVGTFVYELVSVKESSGTTCSNAASGTATVTVRELPTASISGNTEVCQYNASPVITFTGDHGVAPFTFTYNINGGANKTVTTVSGNSITVQVPTNTDGTFTYTLMSVSESGISTCANTASGSVQVIVNPRPVTAIIAVPNTHLCNGEDGTITVFNWQEGFTYTWYKGGVLFTTSTAQSIAVTQAGSYTVMATSDRGCNAAAVSNAIVITIGSISTPVITGFLKVCESGKTKLLVSPKNQSMAYERYRWTDTPIGDTFSTDKSFSAFAGQYQVLVARQGCYDSASVTVSATDTEFPAGELQITPKQILYGGQATLMAKVTGAASYEWDLGDSRKAVTFSNKMVENYFTRADSITVKVRAISERNCRTDFVATLKVGKPDSAVLDDHSWTGNLKDWNVFPVPFRDALKLSVILKRAETVRVDLFTGEGSWVRSWTFKGVKGENLFAFDRVADLTANVVYFITGVYNGEKHFDKIYKY